MPSAWATSMDCLSSWVRGCVLNFWDLLVRRVLGGQWKRWHQAEHIRGSWVLLVVIPVPYVAMILSQIAKDVKQFYDQALQQAVVDDDANNAKAVVKTFHETVQLGWSRRAGCGIPGVYGDESCLFPDLSSKTGHG